MEQDRIAILSIIIIVLVFMGLVVYSAFWEYKASKCLKPFAVNYC